MTWNKKRFPFGYSFRTSHQTSHNMERQNGVPYFDAEDIWEDPALLFGRVLLRETELLCAIGLSGSNLLTVLFELEHLSTRIVCYRPSSDEEGWIYHNLPRTHGSIFDAEWYNEKKSDLLSGFISGEDVSEHVLWENVTPSSALRYPIEITLSERAKSRVASLSLRMGLTPSAFVENLIHQHRT